MNPLSPKYHTENELWRDPTMLKHSWYLHMNIFYSEHIFFIFPSMFYPGLLYLLTGERHSIPSGAWNFVHCGVWWQIQFLGQRCTHQVENLGSVWSTDNDMRLQCPRKYIRICIELRLVEGIWICYIHYISTHREYVFATHALLGHSIAHSVYSAFLNWS